MSKKPLIGINSIFKSDKKYSSDDLRARDYYEIQSSYVDAIAKAGGIPIIVPCFNDKTMLSDYLMHLDGFIFTGGADLPPELYGEERNSNVLSTISSRRAVNDMFMARELLKTDIPILGICLGCQLLNVAAGGKLIQHLKTTDGHRTDEHDAYHQVNVIPGTMLSEIFGTDLIDVNSAHHQAVEPECTGLGFSVAAYALDGTIEAIEMKQKAFVLGVQWHPERIADQKHKHKLFSALICAGKIFALSGRANLNNNTKVVYP